MELPSESTGCGNEREEFCLPSISFRGKKVSSWE